MDEFIKIQLKTKPQWKDPEKVALKIDRDILKNKKLRLIIVFSIENLNNGLELQLTWGIDDKISVMPMYVLIDEMIRVHVFISMLALLLSNLLYWKIQLSGIAHSKDICFESLGRDERNQPVI